ncbi:sensor histidine kinase [Flavobacterium sp. UBA7663]|uniref:sensor histidine kinase n=1 Tax=Flavobacterium sp. UBA7663 TaxID=1946557 RepID=UPI0025BD0D51|nr:GAF domain-containing sensor histidine kinase [Flavobacterium sp. UBA7663]
MDPNREQQFRLKALEEYKILDTLPEKMYDDIVTIASHICNMPIVLLSLVDDKRQFFKSKVGIDIAETPVEYAVCYHAILSQEELFEVPDLREDDRFKNNPLVTGGPKMVSYFGVSLKNSDGISFGTLCVISQDNPRSISDDQKLILKKLANQVIHLLELRKQNFELKRYQEEAAYYSSQMEDFAHTAAHDLRAPLRAVKSFLQLIELKRVDDVDEKEKKYFEFIYTNVDMMNQLIIDLLDYAKSDSKIDEKEVIDLNVFIAQIFNSLVEHHHLSSSMLHLKQMPTIHYSKLALHMIFYNLIDNSLKYRNQERVLELKISYKSDLFHYYFEVEDNGIGISAEYYDIIFKPFKRLHAKSEFVGSGLGLASVKKITQKLGGTISVKSTLGKGTKFTITIPKE